MEQQKYRAKFWRGRIVRVREHAAARPRGYGVVTYTNGEDVVVRFADGVVLAYLLSRQEVDAL